MKISTHGPLTIAPNRRNPYRNQIDFILAPQNFKSINTNAYSVNNTTYSSDHKLVISYFILGKKVRHQIYKTTKTTKNIPVGHLSKHKDEYNSIVDSKISNTNFNFENPTESWDKLCQIYISSTSELNPQTQTKTKNFNPDIQNLSEKQKLLKHQIDNSKSRDKAINLKKQRNKILKQIHNQVKADKNQKLENQILEIENSKNDSHRMFKAIKIIQKKTTTEKLVITKDGITVGNTQNKIGEISNHFKSIFQKPTENDIPFLEPTN